MVIICSKLFRFVLIYSSTNTIRRPGTKEESIRTRQLPHPTTAPPTYSLGTRGGRGGGSKTIPKTNLDPLGAPEPPVDASSGVARDAAGEDVDQDTDGQHVAALQGAYQSPHAEEQEQKANCPQLHPNAHANLDFQCKCKTW